MKLTLLILLFTNTVYAQTLVKSINPKFLHTNFFKIFDSYSISEDIVYVRGVKYAYDDYIDEGNRFEIKRSLFERAQILGESVFEATPGDTYDAAGSAFHVGENFVLTSQHVLSTNRYNTTSCGHFSIKLNENGRNKTLKCKKVHYCDKEIDFCLIEMFEHRRGYALKNQVAPKLKSGPEFGEKLLMMSIGNTRGFGLHAALGYGFLPYNGLGMFYAPVFGGNSGGAVFNEEDEVIALIRAQSQSLFSEESYNVAVPLFLIKSELTEHVGADVMAKLNF